jgi:MFS family permease
MAEQQQIRKSKKGAWRTVSALGIAEAVDNGEGNILSVLFPAIRETLNLDVSHLGTVASVSTIIGLVVRPLWSYLADRYSRKGVLVWVTGVWGLWTLVLGFAGAYWQLFALGIVSSAGLVATSGARDSLIADLFPRERRGRAAGTVTLIAALGGVAAVLFAGRLIEVSDISWRIACWLFGGLSILSGVLMWFLVKEPARGESEEALADTKESTIRQIEAQHPFALRKISLLFRTPSLVIGLLDSFWEPSLWGGLLTFGVTWLVDERGISHSMATYAMGTFAIGLALGGLLGGRFGDWADRRSPRRGRLVVGHLALALAVVVSYLLFRIQWQGHLPYWLLYAAVGLLMEIMYSGAGVPVRMAVTLPELRATSSTLDSIARGLVGFAQSYLIGQIGLRMGLSTALGWTVIGANVLHALIWCAYYVFYPRDTARMQQTLAERRDALVRDVAAQPAAPSGTPALQPAE